MPLSPTILWRLALGLMLLALPLAVGCGGKGGSGDKGTISGKVTVKGVAPAAGTVIKYIGADGKDSSSAIDSDGNYSVSDVAPGEAKITVSGVPGGSGPTVKGDMPGVGGAKGATVPPKYATAGAIPAFTVKSGKNENNINLD